MVLRRTKLEELLHAIYAAQDHLSLMLHKALDREEPPADSNIRIAKVLCALYFQELGIEVSQFTVHYHVMESAIAEVRLSSYQHKSAMEMAHLRDQLLPDADNIAYGKATELAVAKANAAYLQVTRSSAIEIAHRILALVSRVMKYAVATGRAESDPTRDLQGALKAVGKTKHMPCVPVNELPKLLRDITAYGVFGRRRDTD
jgi:hypothetical protein